ncbi:MAG: M48 family metalloprotease [Candidatus Omnitrophica bacterium]|nr:M48 family metalloprotease [Candidatus Omnitrophota bacterium]MBU4479081.1 M48 family metalloprotease [Candidatus Omnitrophota bacterium]MCG2703002.1 M48 family metalloprotease [Candidatus Omnitrophota bacterium]
MNKRWLGLSLQQKKAILFFFYVGITFLYFFLMAYSLSHPLQQAVNTITENSIIVITIYLFLFYAGYILFTLVPKYYEEYILCGESERRSQGVFAWLEHIVKQELVVFFPFLFIVQVVYFFLDDNADWWWLPAGILSIAVMSFCSGFIAKYVVPLLFPSRLSVAPDIKERLIKLAAGSNMKISGVGVMPQMRAMPDAAVIGIGPERKIILSETLLTYSAEEIEVAVAQEIARHYYGHLWKTILVQSAGLLAGFFLIGRIFEPVTRMFGFEFIFYIETLPVLLGLCLIAFILVAVFIGMMRRDMEKKEDEFVLRITELPEAFVSLLIRLEHYNYALESMATFFTGLDRLFSVSIRQRINVALDYAQSLRFSKLQRGDKKRI